MRSFIRFIAVAFVCLFRGLNVRPKAASGNARYSRTRDSVLPSEYSLVSASGDGFAYLYNLTLGELIHVMLFALSVWGMMAAFPNRINLIFQICAKKKMVWAYTWRVVARMADLQSICNWAKMNYPRCAMAANILLSAYSLFLHAIIFDSAIAVSAIGATSPQPAAISFVDELPKAPCHWYSHLWHGLIALRTAIISCCMAFGDERYIAN